jgi:asparagine synthase (glutamine-hydrolysing)
VRRDPDYYGRNAGEAMRVAGGMWSAIDAHYVGAADQIREANPGTILTGCYADYMFKGLLLNRRLRTLFGRNLPLYEPADFAWEYYQPFGRLADQWQQQVKGRLESRFPEDLRRKYAQNRLAVENLRLRPLSREPDASGRACLWRTQPWDPFLFDNDVLSVYSRLSAEMKLNGIVFGRAVGKVIGPAGRQVPNNNYGTPVDASEAERAFWFLMASFKRKLRRAFGRENHARGLASSGSWPNWDYYVGHSPVIAEQWNNPGKELRGLFSNILGRDPWQMPLAEWARTDSLVFMRLWSAKLWLQQRGILK